MSAPFSSFVDLLTAGQTHRVWSLLITVFGDLAQDKGQKISGTTLNRIMAAIGVKPEATRVALHRLRKDGWITSQRVGRQSEYSLTGQGRAESAQASPRIYGTDVAQMPVYLVMARPDPSPSVAPQGGQTGPVVSWITPVIGLARGPRHGPDCLVLPVPTGTDLPPWMRARVCSEPLVAASIQSETVFIRLKQALDQAPPLTPFETAVLRVLIVHSWRRIILRAPDLPDAVFPVAWRGAQCRQLANGLLSFLPRPDPGALSDPAQDTR